MTHSHLFLPSVFTRSVLSLCIELAILKDSRNLMPPGSRDKGMIFLSDSDIPLPRPATALAWASLCTLESFFGTFRRNGFNDFSLDSGHFLVPFLPRLLLNDNQSTSLGLQFNSHAKDQEGRIQWGAVYVGEVESGELFGSLAEASMPVNGFALSQQVNALQGIEKVNNKLPDQQLPPLWADFRDGWVFGANQEHTSVTFMLRTPMEMLAMNGIPISYRRTFPTKAIRRLLFRFLSFQTAKLWAESYSKAMLSVTGEGLPSIQADEAELKEELSRFIKKATEGEVGAERGKRSSGLSTQFKEALAETSSIDSLKDLL